MQSKEGFVRKYFHRNIEIIDFRFCREIFRVPIANILAAVVLATILLMDKTECDFKFSNLKLWPHFRQEANLKFVDKLLSFLSEMTDTTVQSRIHSILQAKNP